MGELAAALAPRFPDAAARSGLYESLYFTAHHPSERQALWVRHTVLKPPGAPPRASLWCTWFADGRVLAGKQSTGECGTSAERALEIAGHGWIGEAGAVGGVDLGSVPAAWDLRFVDPEPPMRHLPGWWLYEGPLPRTKSISAAPALTLAGSLTVGGEPVAVDGWPATIGHNWGTEHARRWIWLRAEARAGEGPVWLDLVVGRVRLGRKTTPWMANGAVSIGGQRHRLGGLSPRSTTVSEQARSALVSVRGRSVSVEAHAELDLAACVAWTYADPVGATREVVNSSVARVRFRVERRGRPSLELSSPVSAFELGAPQRAFDVPLQPFPD